MTTTTEMQRSGWFVAIIVIWCIWCIYPYYNCCF